jgi:alkaline phosphatase D
MNRRETLTGIAGLALGSRLRGAGGEPPHGAAGERVGEVTATSAIVHARLTAAPTRNNRGYSFPVHTHNLSTMNQLRLLRMPDKMPLSELEGACAGKAGRARLRYGVDPKLAGAAVTPWVEVGPKTDFTHQFALKGLQPGAAYYYSLETSLAAGGDARQGAPGSFKTAPERNDWRPVRFFVLSCQDYGCRDDIDGFRAYRSMNRLGADFTASVGDNVYYDLDLPFATTVDIARFHWQRMYSQPLVMDLFRNMSGYWLKDDHDSYSDDDWPGYVNKRMLPFTWEQGLKIFPEQTTGLRVRRSASPR